MHLTTMQRNILAADIAANPTLAAYKAAGNLNALASHYSEPASPAFMVWRTGVGADEIGNAWSGADIDGMSALNMQRLQLLLASSPAGTFNMSRADRRTGFLNPFGTSPTNASRVAMLALWKQPVDRFARLFATGTGTDATPGLFGVDAQNETIESAPSASEFEGL